MKKTTMMKKNYEFKTVLSKGQYYSGKYIEAFIKKSKPKDKNYLGIAIRVKLAKAVKRNRIKRLIRENYYAIEEQLKTGYAIVFLGKKKVDITTATFIDVKKDIKKIFDKAQMIEENK